MQNSGRALPTRLRLFTSLGFMLGLLVAHGQTPWETNFASAVKKATASKKPIFVDFHASWCGPCKQLDEVFKEARAKALLAHAVCLSIDVDKDQADAQRFNVTGIPRLLLLSSDGRKTQWDTTGFGGADAFISDFSEALKVKLTAADEVRVASDPPLLTSVETALASDKFAAYKAQNPAAANTGLRLLVAKLGVYKESDFKPLAALVQKAGRDALPALIDGMADKSLAVRVGAHKMALAVLKPEEAKSIAFNPWAVTSIRTQQLMAWRRLISAK